MWEELSIPTICQWLFYQGCELMDNMPDVATLGILANDVLDLHAEQENEELLNTDMDVLNQWRFQWDIAGPQLDV